MDGDRWGATETRLTTDIRRAVRRELDPKKRPNRTPHDFARIRNFLMDLEEDVINQQPPMSHLDQSEFLRQNLSSFMTKNFSDPGMQFCPTRLNFYPTRNEQRKRKRDREAEEQLVEEAKQRRLAGKKEAEKQARLADWHASQERLKNRSGNLEASPGASKRF